MRNPVIRQRTQEKTCDFCGVENPCYALPCGTFIVDEVKFAGEWLVCESCLELIARSQRHLLAHVCCMLALAGLSDQGFQMAFPVTIKRVKYLHDEFFRHWNGEVKELTDKEAINATDTNH